MFLHQLLLVCPLLCFLLLPLSIYLLAPEEDNFCRKRLCTVVSLCFGIRCFGGYIFLDLFYFVNLTSSCLHIPQIRELFFGLSIHLLRPPSQPSWVSQSTFLGLPFHFLGPPSPLLRPPNPPSSATQYTVLGHPVNLHRPLNPPFRTSQSTSLDLPIHPLRPSNQPWVSQSTFLGLTIHLLEPDNPLSWASQSSS